MKPEVKERLLKIKDKREFMRALKELFPGKKQITLADFDEEVIKHMMKYIFNGTPENHTDPREAFIRKRGD